MGNEAELAIKLLQSRYRDCGFSCFRCETFFISIALKYFAYKMKISNDIKTVQQQNKISLNK